MILIVSIIYIYNSIEPIVQEQVNLSPIEESSIAPELPRNDHPLPTPLYSQTTSRAPIIHHPKEQPIQNLTKTSV